jgi:hypothetical protein
LYLLYFNEKLIVLVFLGQFFPELTEEDRLYGWFHQDSTTVQTAHMSMQAFSDVFEERIIGSNIWPASSPDLNPCDFSSGGL